MSNSDFLMYLDCEGGCREENIIPVPMCYMEAGESIRKLAI